MGAPLGTPDLLVRPDTVLKAAEQLGIEPIDIKQIHILALAKAFLEAPLPSSWARSLDEHGNWAYISKRSGQSHAEHPQLSQYQHLVSSLALHPPKDYERKTCMRFARADGTTYIHDFRTEAKAEVALSSEVAPDVAAAPDTQQEAPAGDPEPASTLDQGPPPADQAETSTPEQQEQPEAAESTGREDAEDAAPTEEPPPPPAEEQPQAEPGAAASSPADDFMIPDIPMVLLESFGLVNAKEAEPLEETGMRAGVHKLCFYSWWYEDIESTDLTFRVNSNSIVGGGLKRRYVTLEYHLRSNRFSIVSHNEDQELRIPDLPVTTKAGEAAEIWDLHVGATMTAMGRTLTLHKADLETSAWNDRHAVRLKQLKVELLAELQKYKPRGHKNEVAFDRGDRVHAGGLSLRYTVEQIKKLAADLQQYRPAQAEKFRSRINIKL